MKAVRVHEFGGLEALKYDDAPAPEPGAGEARVKVEAAGVNFIDVYHRKGLYRGAMPLTLGQEAAGVVETLGSGVTEVNIGERVVFASVQGTYAEYVVAPVWRLVPIPANVDTRAAAAGHLQGLTAHYLAFSTYPLQPGHTALVHAAAGGMGQLLTQIARRRGARVIATVSTEAKAKIAREMGADEVINYADADFEVEVKRLTNGTGVDVVYDSVGKTTFDQSLNCLKRRGTMVLYGQSSGPVPPLDPQVLNAKGSLYLTRPTLAHYTASREELLERANDLFRWMASGELKVTVDRTFALAEADKAHQYLESRQTRGKLLLLP
jgi:NADPH2:quinone reductase